MQWSTRGSDFYPRDRDPGQGNDRTSQKQYELFSCRSWAVPVELARDWRCRKVGPKPQVVSELELICRTKLRSAFQETHANADKLLYVLLYAFLASVDVSGEYERVAGQLGTGMTLARSMGGLDRPDGVGNGALGAWYAHRLSSGSDYQCMWAPLISQNCIDTSITSDMIK
jgi:hypothetical protein